MVLGWIKSRWGSFVKGRFEKEEQKMAEDARAVLTSQLKSEDLYHKEGAASQQLWAHSKAARDLLLTTSISEDLKQDARRLEIFAHNLRELSARKAIILAKTKPVFVKMLQATSQIQAINKRIKRARTQLRQKKADPRDLAEVAAGIQQQKELIMSIEQGLRQEVKADISWKKRFGKQRVLVADLFNTVWNECKYQRETLTNMGKSIERLEKIRGAGGRLMKSVSEARALFEQVLRSEQSVLGHASRRIKELRKFAQAEHRDLEKFAVRLRKTKPVAA